MSPIRIRSGMTKEASQRAIDKIHDDLPALSKRESMKTLLSILAAGYFLAGPARATEIWMRGPPGVLNTPRLGGVRADAGENSEPRRAAQARET
jgi:hypothetical protein